jgi:hypothetical protein
MTLRHHVRTFLMVSCLLFHCSINYRPAWLVNGFGKLIVFLLFASLLAFVVVHSSEIRRLAIAFFETLKLPLFALLVDPQRLKQPAIVVIRSTPFFSPRFQRPPPLPSL